MKRFRHLLFKWFGVDWWERLGYSTHPEDRLCGSHIIDIRRSRITGEMEQLYFTAAAGGVLPPVWVPIDEELRAFVEWNEND